MTTKENAAQTAERDRLAQSMTTDWMQSAVLGLNLCPFAHGPVGAGRVRVAVAPGRTLAQAVQEWALFVHELLDDPQTDTTLVTFPCALDDFEEFLDALDLAHRYVEDRELESVVQLASFHPEYRFEGTDPSEPSNYTNRSPLPILQILRVEQVAKAIDAHGQTETIPDANMARVRGLSFEEREALRALPQMRCWQGEPKGPLRCESKALVTFSGRGLSSSRTFEAGTQIDPGPWATRVVHGEVERG